MTRKPNFVKSKRNQTRRTALRFGLVVAALVSLMVLGFSSSANYKSNPSIRVKIDNGVTSSVAPNGGNIFSRFLSALLSAPKPQTANLDQLRNGSFDKPNTDPDWVNGNAGASNAHYREGGSIPYRLRLDNLSLGEHTVIIEWDTRHSGVNAIDFITYFDRLSDSNPDPLKGLDASSYFIDPPTDIPAPADSMAADFFDNLPAAERTFTTYNTSAVLLEYVNQDPLVGNQTSTSLKITFTATAPNVLFAWGGHIASRLDWGFDSNGVPLSAGGISGSPYHTRLLDLDGSGGNQDRSLSAAAVLPPAGCTITAAADVCAGTNKNYTASGADPAASFTFTWTLTGNGTFDTGGQSKITNGTGSSTVNVVADSLTTDGSYVLSVVISGSGFTDSTCDTGTVNVRPVPVVSITTNSACPGAPTLTADLSGNTDTDVTHYTFSWTGPGGSTASTQSIMPTTTGTYSVTVTRSGCTSAPASGTLCLVFTSN